jgi:2-oxoglutarate dehydrogenase E1 component
VALDRRHRSAARAADSLSPGARHRELRLTIWDLDRVFITDGLANRESMTLREILDVLQRAYCGKVGIEYRHIQSKEEKQWIREQIRREFVATEPIPVEVKKRCCGN